MSVENISDPPSTLPSPVAVANKFESHSSSLYGNRLITMAQRECIPHEARVLGIGAAMAVLGNEIAIYRRDIHWINAAPSYDYPELETIDDKLIELNTVDLELLPDVYPEKHFDRIFLYNDPPELDATTGEKLIDLLSDGGELQIAHVPRDFIRSTNYQPGKKLLIYKKSKTYYEPNPYLTVLPVETNNQPIITPRPANTTPSFVPALSLLPFGIGDHIDKRINYAKRIGRALLNLPYGSY